MGLSFLAWLTTQLPWSSLRRFVLKSTSVRTALFNMMLKEANDQNQGRLISIVEDYLFHRRRATSSRDWKLWITSCRLNRRLVDTRNRVTSEAILDVYRAGMLEGLSEEDYEYLLSCYLASYATILAGSPADRRQMLPILIESASIAQLFDIDKTTFDILQRWLIYTQSRPHSLASMSDEEAISAPIRGIGSPSGVNITYYYTSAGEQPIQLSFAGTTGDPTLNRHLFSCLFAMALACDSE
jgi:hypothetical protein